MRIVSVTDLHGDPTNIEAVLQSAAPVDVLLLSGDITHFGDARDVAGMLDPIVEKDVRVLAVAGNCDYPDVHAWLEEHGLGIHGRHVVVDGIAFLGAGGSLPCPGPTPNEVRGDKAFEEILQAAARGVPQDVPAILLTHQPPKDTLNDLASYGGHVGSQAIRDFIEETVPLACLCGHIHEAQGVDRIGATRVANPGPLREAKYALVVVEDGAVRVTVEGVG